MTSNSLTDEEKASRKSTRDASIKTLENLLLQGVVGGNRAQSNPSLYGQLSVDGAKATLQRLMSGEQITKYKESQYQSNREKGESLGVFGEPNYPTNYEVSLKYAEILEDSKRKLSLRDLYEITKKYASGFEFELPSELEDFTPQDLLDQANELQISGNKEYEFNEHERDAFIAYNILSQAYDRGITLRASQSGQFTDLNDAANQISDKYNKPEEK